ncbi:hypothetical protein DL96DRAFT_1720994 [Flagelloscypha sp. PMI_526]|nr:hypothetical protein DL96DRAFT_1720994 [Flagelloscypha sp. PMI_526]
MTPDLAPEITSYILCFCDRRTLRKCCILSQEFYILAGSVLYAKLSIDKQLLSSILQTGSESGSFSRLHFAKEITIHLKHLRPNLLVPFSQILGSLPSLRLLKLFALRPTSDEVSAINSICSSTSSTSYSFSWDISSSIGDSYDDESIAPATGLSALSDLRVMAKWPIRSGANSQILEHRPVLHTLRLECEPKPWSGLEALVDITQLQRLCFWLGGAHGFQDHNPPRHIFDLCAHSLRILSMFKSTIETSSQDPINRPFPRLETLILWISQHPFPICSWVTATVGTMLLQSPNLRRLCLYIHLAPTGGKTFSGILKNNEEFEELFTFLASQKSLLRIEVWFWSPGRSAPDTAELDLECSMRKLLEAGGWMGLLKCVWYRNWTEIWPFWERDKYMSPYAAAYSEDSD